VKVGVLAVQGNFREHAAMLRRLGADVSWRIRAQRVRETGPEVEVLAELDGEPVLLREGRFLVASFHPELTEDTRVHERFLELVREETNVRA
jgi:glutamine amidotransferase PdxT